MTLQAIFLLIVSLILLALLYVNAKQEGKKKKKQQPQKVPEKVSPYPSSKVTSDGDAKLRKPHLYRVGADSSSLGTPDTEERQVEIGQDATSYGSSLATVGTSDTQESMVQPQNLASYHSSLAPTDADIRERMQQQSLTPYRSSAGTSSADEGRSRTRQRRSVSPHSGSEAKPDAAAKQVEPQLEKGASYDSSAATPVTATAHTKPTTAVEPATAQKIEQQNVPPYYSSTSTSTADERRRTTGQLPDVSSRSGSTAKPDVTSKYMEPQLEKVANYNDLTAAPVTTAIPAAPTEPAVTQKAVQPEKTATYPSSMSTSDADTRQKSQPPQPSSTTSRSSAITPSTHSRQRKHQPRRVTRYHSSIITSDARRRQVEQQLALRSASRSATRRSPSVSSQGVTPSDSRPRSQMMPRSTSREPLRTATAPAPPFTEETMKTARPTAAEPKYLPEYDLWLHPYAQDGGRSPVRAHSGRDDGSEVAVILKEPQCQLPPMAPKEVQKLLKDERKSDSCKTGDLGSPLHTATVKTDVPEKKPLSASTTSTQPRTHEKTPSKTTKSTQSRPTKSTLSRSRSKPPTSKISTPSRSRSIEQRRKHRPHERENDSVRRRREQSVNRIMEENELMSRQMDEAYKRRRQRRPEAPKKPSKKDEQRRKEEKKRREEEAKRRQQARTSADQGEGAAREVVARRRHHSRHRARGEVKSRSRSTVEIRT